MTGDSRDPGDAFAHLLNVGLDPRQFANDGAIDVGDPESGLANVGCCDLEEVSGIGSPPRVVGRGEPVAYVARRNCAQQGIGHCVKSDISVRMTVERLVKRDPDATKDHVVSLGETVDIKSVSNPNIQSSILVFTC